MGILSLSRPVSLPGATKQSEVTHSCFNFPRSSSKLHPNQEATHPGSAARRSHCETVPAVPRRGRSAPGSAGPWGPLQAGKATEISIKTTAQRSENGHRRCRNRLGTERGPELTSASAIFPAAIRFFTPRYSICSRTGILHKKEERTRRDAKTWQLGKRDWLMRVWRFECAVICAQWVGEFREERREKMGNSSEQCRMDLILPVAEDVEYFYFFTIFVKLN